MAKMLTPPPRPTEPLLPCSTLDRVDDDACEWDLLRIVAVVAVGFAAGLLLSLAVWGAR